jgi:hypothetical protein
VRTFFSFCCCPSFCVYSRLTFCCCSNYSIFFTCLSLQAHFAKFPNCKIFENTRVTEVASISSPHTVKAETGSAQAKHVVLATVRHEHASTPCNDAAVAAACADLFALDSRMPELQLTCFPSVLLRLRCV